MFRLAVAYAYGLARDAPLVDGNKRTALAVTATFPLLNGRKLGAPEAEAVGVFLRRSEGNRAEQAPGGWLEQNSVRC